ncbi:MAG: ribosome small subunit-dependent GTPase A [Lachnospiraceae bacterium]|nr:ribosome small subunit-dependent GTPase A [Lachnospiraceae bacterium]
MNGIILKGIGGFYYVKTDENGAIYECRARGIFRKRDMKPLVGDRVRIEVTHEEDMEGSIEEIHERKSALIRPAVANVDKALVIFALKTPDPVLTLLDTFLINMRMSSIPTTLVFNKSDLVDDETIEKYSEIYSSAGVELIFTSTKTGRGIDAVKRVLENSVTTVAGPSGAGKSTLINTIAGRQVMETGKVSAKIGRGKQTTRHTELLDLGNDSYIMDTPGFSTLVLPEMEKEDLALYYPEFDDLRDSCYFSRCVHIHEPGCKVRESVESGKINKVRYESYLSLYEELAGRRRY